VGARKLEQRSQFEIGFHKFARALLANIAVMSVLIERSTNIGVHTEVMKSFLIPASYFNH
jgi:hypothetical protein